jgi:hypothetical protein
MQVIGAVVDLIVILCSLAWLLLYLGVGGVTLLCVGMFARVLDKPMSSRWPWVFVWPVYLPIALYVLVKKSG